MLKMTVTSVCSESNKLLVHLTPKNSTSAEVYTSAEVDSRMDTSLRIFCGKGSMCQGIPVGRLEREAILGKSSDGQK